MNILLIDTCAEQGSVAIADPVADPARGFSAALPGRSASEKLIGSIRDLANQSGIVLRDIGAIAVVNGPGSFTGIRVGLSAAKGLCEALGIPLMVISRLAVLASLARAQPEASVIAALDAGRGEFYFGEYSCGDKLREGLASREALAQVLSFSSSALIVHEHALVNSLAEFSPRLVPELDAAAALPLAIGRLQRKEFDDVATADANYLRRTDLEIFAKVRARAVADVT